MTPAQFQVLLGQLAGVAGVADASSLLLHGQLRVEGKDAVLAHNSAHDDSLLQVRMVVGDLPPDQAHVACALLDSNYQNGGRCVFSLHSESDTVLATVQLRMQPSLTAQDLWQDLCAMALAADALWESITTSHASEQEPA
jgi:hypothetical protein